MKILVTGSAGGMGAAIATALAEAGCRVFFVATPAEAFALRDIIPGAELINAKRMVDAAAAVITHGPTETAQAIISLLSDEESTEAMALRSQTMARPNARREIAGLVLSLLAPAKEGMRRLTA